jgi:hypothetical protein
MLELKILQRDDKEANHHKNDPRNPSPRKYFANKKDGPDLGEERGRAGDRVDQGEITFPVGPNKTEEIDGFEEAGGSGKPPEFESGMGEQGGKDSETDEERKVEKDPPEKDPEKKFPWPISPLGEEIP